MSWVSFNAQGGEYFKWGPGISLCALIAGRVAINLKIKIGVLTAQYRAKDFAKANEKFEIKALSVGGKLLDAGQIDVLATLPTHDQALSILMSVMLAPVTKLARTLNEVPSKITRGVAAVRDQKQEAA